MSKLKQYTLTGAVDIGISGWDSDSFDNSGLKWSSGDNKWIPMPSSAGSDTSATLTIATASGIAASVAVKHDGAAGTLYLVDIPQNVIKSGANWSKAYASAQIAIYEDTDTHPGSGQLTATTPINIDTANAYVIGEAAALTIDADSITQAMLKSGAEYWKAYQSGQVALYEETYGDEASLTSVLDDNYAPSTASHGLYHPSGEIGSKITWGTLVDGDGISDFSTVVSGAGDTVSFDTTWGDARYYTQDTADGNFHPSGEANLTSLLDDNYAPSSGYNTHINDTAKHYTSGSAKNWFDSLYAISGDYLTEIEADALYAPTGTAGSVTSGAITLASGLSSNDTIYHVDSATTLFIASASLWNKAYESGQIALYSVTTHKDSHDPNDGSDALDCAAAGEIVGVTAAAEGTSHSFARSDHTHQIQHAITNDHIVTMDDDDATDNDYARFTANGLEGRSYSEVWSDISGQAAIDDLSDTTGISSPASGELLFYDGTQWANKMSTMNFNIANVRLSSQQNINLTRFTCPAGKKCYIWQACACNSGGISVADLSIELLSGSTSVYSTSSSTLQEGNPLAVSDGGNTEIRFMYSGSNASGIEYGTAFMNISVY